MTKTSRVAGLVVLLALAGVGAGRLVGAPQGGPVDPLPLAQESYMLGDDIAAYRSFIMSGGPPPDGIPSIDAPIFVDASEARLSPGAMIIGFVHEGEARAYPQSILVYHEIVNDRVGDLNVAITYCPLTATAQGFRRGDVTLGVSGQLLNSNLVMYDRESGSYFSQIAATGLTGVHAGRTLQEIELVWTTWERWSTTHPNTKVLSDRTGYLRNYARDPYGRYDPPGGYYTQNATLFPLMHRAPEHPLKTMVVGVRTADRSAYFVLEELASAGVLLSPGFVAVYDRALHTGLVYLRPSEGPAIEALADGRYQFGDQSYTAGGLPLDRVVAMQAFHFAWHAFYPESETAVLDA